MIQFRLQLYRVCPRLLFAILMSQIILGASCLSQKGLISKANHDNPTFGTYYVYSLQITSPELGKFYTYQNKLFRIHAEDLRLVIEQIDEGITSRLWEFNLERKLDGISLVSSSEKESIFYILGFSNDEKVIIECNLNSGTFSTLVRLEEFRAFLAFYFMSDLEMFVTLDRTLCRLIEKQGSISIVELGNDNDQYYSSCGANESSFALNIDHGLSVYEVGKPPLRIWEYDHELGAPSEIASVGECWLTTIVNSHRAGKHALRFCPEGEGYVHEIIDLPDGFWWRLTDIGDLGVIWSRNSPDIFLVNSETQTQLTLPQPMGDMKICPGRSDRVLFLIGNGNYATLQIPDNDR